MKLKTSIAISIFALSALSASGCDVEGFSITDAGDTCPPVDAEEGAVLAYIVDPSCTAEKCELGSFASSFNVGFCPIEYPDCKPSIEAGKYFCINAGSDVSCGSGQKRCLENDSSAICVDPTSAKSCGATCDDNGLNYKVGAVCPENTTCALKDNKYTCICKDGSMSCGSECIDSSANATCGANSCDAENYGGDNCNNYEDSRICQLQDDQTYKCVCKPGYLMCDGKCIYPKSSSDFCGAKGNCNSSESSNENFKGYSCGDNGYCNEGKCECVGESTWCSLNGTTQCYEMQSNEHCNVKADPDTKECVFSVCASNEKCKYNYNYSNNSGDEYTCQITSCSDENQLLCTFEDVGATCVSKTDPQHCGNCSKDCTQNSMSNAKGNGCAIDESGSPQCTYKCDDGYTNCGTDFNPKCVKLDTAENCGSCGKICDVKQTCDPTSLSCVATDCEETLCTDPNTKECANSADQCGKGCANCINKFGSNEAFCNPLGVCTINQCPSGKYPIFNENSVITECKSATETECAPNTLGVSDNVVDCTKNLPENAETRVCNSQGSCEVSTCSSGYHISPDKKSCVKNSETSCGGVSSNKTVNCTTAFANSSSTSCEDGTCKLVSCKFGYKQSSSSCDVYSVNDTLKFGTYKQTKAGNDKTAIEWIVLSKDTTNKRYLLISTLGLDIHSFDSNTGHSWKNSSIRDWLNGTFYNNAFTSEDQTHIYEVTNSTDGEESIDKIFLLSKDEVTTKYYVAGVNVQYAARVAYASAYTAAQHTKVRDSNDNIIEDGTCTGKCAVWWWLRSRSGSTACADIVKTAGIVSNEDTPTNTGVVRPAIWIQY